jgi:predicted small secreted protein
MTSIRSSRGTVRIFVTLLLLALSAALTGCGTLNGFGQVGSDLRPTAGASVSVPLGK